MLQYQPMALPLNARVSLPDFNPNESKGKCAILNSVTKLFSVYLVPISTLTAQACFPERSLAQLPEFFQ